MKKTAFNLDSLSGMVSSDCFASLKGIIEDLDLELEDATAL